MTDCHYYETLSHHYEILSHNYEILTEEGKVQLLTAGLFKVERDTLPLNVNIQNRGVGAKGEKDPSHYNEMLSHNYKKVSQL